MSGGRIGKPANKSGEWKLNEKEKTLTLITPEYPNDSGDYELLKLSRKNLILRKGAVKIYLDRGTK